MLTELLVLRLVHVLCGIYWVGSGLASTIFVVPALAEAGPATMGTLMPILIRRKYFTAMFATALLTMLSGARLLWIISGGFSQVFFATAMGHVYLTSAVLTVIGFLGTVLVSGPSNAKAGMLAAQAATAPAEAQAGLRAEADRIRRRGRIATLFSVACVALAAAGMAVARYAV